MSVEQTPSFPGVSERSWQRVLPWAIIRSHETFLGEVRHTFATKEGLVSFSTSADSLPRRFRVVLASFLQQPGLPFADVLPEERIQAAFDDEEVAFAQDEDAIYTPSIALWALLSQMLFKQEQRSCVAAVSRVIVLLVALGQKSPSGNTGAYCRARAKLPVSVIRRLASELADGCERETPKHWLWKGRHVKLVDGSTCSMPDTEKNQAAYPQPTTQEPGLGFPIARFVVLLSLATAMISDLAIGPHVGKETGELALLRELLERLNPDDILLADRLYCSYFMICLLLAAKVDFVTRLHPQRTADFRRGKRLGAGDHMVAWPRPPKPDWMNQATYDEMPESITVREVEVAVAQPGFRTESLVVVTTLTDAQLDPRQDIAELYHHRWLAELDLRAIKATMGMDVLRAQSPEMVQREIWACLLAYNLIRRTMLASAMQSDRSPRDMSFTAAMQKIAAGWTTVLLLEDSVLDLLLEEHLNDLPHHRIGHRPNRVEPRAIKRRPKPHKLLTKPRKEAQADLLAGKA
jgi:putative transposase